MGLLDLLNQAINSQQNNGQQNAPQFGKVAEQAPQDVLAKGLSAAFGSKETPAVGNMVGQLFGQSNGAQQAGMLNHLMRALGPMVVAGLASGALGKILKPGQTEITPEQAAKISPEVVQEVVNQANDSHPGIADQMGEFYAQHKGLIHILGGLAATIALTQMKDHLTNKE
jgi:hypothetical protein